MSTSRFMTVKFDVFCVSIHAHTHTHKHAHTHTHTHTQRYTNTYILILYIIYIYNYNIEANNIQNYKNIYIQGNIFYRSVPRL